MVLTKEHWEQLYEYSRWAKESDICYGDQDEFEKRHNDIEEYLAEMIESED
jgi:hypothetical protein